MKNNKTHKSICKRNGFTLMELMIVVAIIGILAGVTYPSYQQYVIRTHRADAAGNLLELSQYLERYFTEVGNYTAATLPFSKSPKDGSTTHYNIAFATGSPTATAYTIQAAPSSGGQTKDTDCLTLTLSSTGAKCIKGSTTTCSDSTTESVRNEVADCW